MASRWPPLAAALVLLSCQRAQASNVAACAIGGRCTSKLAADSPVSLLQTYTSEKTKNSSMVPQFQANWSRANIEKYDEAVEAIGGAYYYYHKRQEFYDRLDTGYWYLCTFYAGFPHAFGYDINKICNISKDMQKYYEPTSNTTVLWPKLTGGICLLSAAGAGFVQAQLGVYSALTFHTLMAFGALCLRPYFDIGVGKASILIMCFCPIMDVVQCYYHWNSKRNWRFILCYGVPELLGLFCGLAVLTYCMSNLLVVGLQGFLLFSCLMALGNEAYARYLKYQADQEVRKEKDVPKHVWPENTPTPNDSEKPIIGVKLTNIDLPAEVPTDTCPSPEQAPTEPPGVDMSKRFNVFFILACGLFAGFSLGSISIGGTFVLLMLNTLEIPIPEWKSTQCVAETPLHWTRALFVMSSGIVIWEKEWINVTGVLVGVTLGLILGNRLAHKIPPWILRACVVGGLCVTVGALIHSMVGEVDAIEKKRIQAQMNHTMTTRITTKH